MQVSAYVHTINAILLHNNSLLSKNPVEVYVRTQDACVLVERVEESN